MLLAKVLGVDEDNPAFVDKADFGISIVSVVSAVGKIKILLGKAFIQVTPQN